MARFRPLRGSVMQNRPTRGRLPSHGFFYKLKLGLLTISIGLIVLGFLFLWGAGGWRARQIDRLTEAALSLSQKAHFAIADVLVEGRSNTGKEALFAALDVHQGSPIFAFDPAAALERVQKLPWVAGAVVERRLPDTIYVRLTERVPQARWQNGNKTVVIDREGKELPDASLEAFASLPLVVGEGAPEQTEALLLALKDYPAIGPLMKAAVRVGARRWNLHLQPKVVARLPEDGMEDALKRLDGLIREQKILDRNIEAIDLRFPGRFILEPATAAATPGQKPEQKEKE